VDPRGRRQFLAAASGLLVASFANAQRPKMRRIGVLAQVFGSRGFWDPMFTALRRHGWREGPDYVLAIKEAGGDPVRALALAKELVQERVELVLAFSTAAALAARQASKTIPIVTWCGYPVEAGLAVSLARPGGNVTGVANYANAEIWGKFVELLREIKPGFTDLGVLWDYTPPGFPDGLIPIPAIEDGARRMGIRTRVWMVRNEPDLDNALSSIDRGPMQALIMSSSGGVLLQPRFAERIGKVIVRRRLPAITDIASTVFTTFGCVLAYSPNVNEIQARLANILDRVLRGANPGELPFERPSKFDLAVNAKSARLLGLALPQGLLLRADRIVE
jgi:putative tryptophan/tyrosine transport system substrate-binding protein